MIIRTNKNEYTNLAQIPKHEVSNVYYLDNIPLHVLNDQNEDIFKFKNVLYLNVFAIDDSYSLPKSYSFENKQVINCHDIISNKLALFQKLVEINTNIYKSDGATIAPNDDLNSVFYYEDKMLVIPNKNMMLSVDPTIKFLNIVNICYHKFNFDEINDCSIENIHISIIDLYLDDFKLINLPISLKHLEISIIADTFQDKTYYGDLMKDRCKIPFGCDININLVIFYAYDCTEHFAVE